MSTAAAPSIDSLDARLRLLKSFRTSALAIARGARTSDADRLAAAFEAERIGRDIEALEAQRQQPR